MFVLPYQVRKNSRAKDYLQGRALKRVPEVVIDFDDPNYRFALKFSELMGLRDRHKSQIVSAGFYHEPGDRIDRLTFGIGRELATVIEVLPREGYGTDYMVIPEVQSSAAQRETGWHKLLTMLNLTRSPQPVKWPGEGTDLVRKGEPSPSVVIDNNA